MPTEKVNDNTPLCYTYPVTVNAIDYLQTDVIKSEIIKQVLAEEFQKGEEKWIEEMIEHDKKKESKGAREDLKDAKEKNVQRMKELLAVDKNLTGKQMASIIGVDRRSIETYKNILRERGELSPKKVRV